MTAHYFLNNRLLGSTEALQTWEGVDPSPNIAHFCPTCGELWGRVTYDRGSPQWQVLTSGCERHPMWSFYPGGTFIRSWNPRQLLELPETVLRREFALHWQHYTGVSS